MKAHRWDWMSVSKGKPQRDELQGLVQDIDNDRDREDVFGHWVPVKGAKLPFSQGYGLRAMIDGFGLPGVSHFCIGYFPSGGALLGLRCMFKGEQRVDVFAVDDGDRNVITIACRVFEPQAREAVPV